MLTTDDSVVDSVGVVVEETPAVLVAGAHVVALGAHVLGLWNKMLFDILKHTLDNTVLN